MLLLAGILMTLATVAAVLAPLFGGAGSPLRDGLDAEEQLRELRALRDVVYETLRDLEYDFHAGKIGAADYEELSERSKREALGILRRIDALESAAPAPGGRGVS